MDLWAVATYDLRLSLEQFEEITPTQFNALCKRRNARLRHDRFASAITASAVYNVNRSSADAPLVEPIDFICPKPEADEQTQQIKKLFKEVIAALPQSTPAAKYKEIRDRSIADLEAQGRMDARELFNECWPTLKD